MALRTRLTEKLGIRYPIMLAPMGSIAGGRLAGAVSRAGGLGLIGGGYGDAAWLEREFAAAGNQRVGCGFITWSLAKNTRLLDIALSYRPVALMLSFGDPQAFSERIRTAGAVLFVRCRAMNMPCKRLTPAPRSLSPKAPKPGAMVAAVPHYRLCQLSPISSPGALHMRWWLQPVVLPMGAALRLRLRLAQRGYW